MNADIHTQLHLHADLLEISTGDLDYDLTEYMYKGNTVRFENSFDLIINTLNDMIFGSLYVILVKDTKSFFGFTKKITVGGATIRLLTLINSKSEEHTYDVVPVLDMMSADYYDKNPPLLGRAKIKFSIEQLDVPLEECKQEGSFSKRMINKLFSAEMSNSFETINELIKFLANGSTACNLKTIAGMLIIDGFMIKKMTCSDSQHLEMDACFKSNCLMGYGGISVEDARCAMRMIDYCLAAFLDSKLFAILFKPRVQLPLIKNSKIRGALERLRIPQEKFIKYIEGSHKLVGFVIFIDNETLVVSLRGTLTSNDVINDLDASYTVFLNGYAHSGILRLAKAFVDTEIGHIRLLLEKHSLKRLLITGYSLGGGVASLVHMIILKNGYITDCVVDTVVYAAPPTVSERLRATEVPHLRTYSFGNDIIPRLSIGSLLDFKFLCLSITNVFDVFSNSDRILDKIIEIHQHLRESNMYPKLYHPGEVYHIKAKSEEGNVTYGFKLIDSRFLADLVIYKNTLPDHLLNGFMDAFRFIGKIDEDGIETCL